MTPAPRRHFLGLDRPAVHAAADWLLDHAAPDHADGPDFDAIRVVVPGGRARRLLTAALVDAAERRRLPLQPPLILTPGEIAVSLLGPPGPAPSDLLRRLAWAEALDAVGDDQLAPLIPLGLADHDLSARTRIAAFLARASADLAAAGLLFKDVPPRAGAFLPADEAERWRALAAVQNRYRALLADWGYADPELAMIPRAIDDANVPDRLARPRVVLLAVPELDAVARAALDRGAGDLDALVYAPEHLADRFDELGCVFPPAWADAVVDLDDHRVAFVDDAAQQADAALLRLSGDHDQPVDPADVVLGLADPGALPTVRRRAQLAAGVAVRSPSGTPLAVTSLGRLVDALHALVSDRTFADLIEFVRQPDVERRLLRASTSRDGEPTAVEDWLERLEDAACEHMLTRLGPTPQGARRRTAAAVNFVSRVLDRALGPLFSEPGAERPLAEWADALRAALADIYGNRRLLPADPDDAALAAALEAARDALDEMRALPEPLDRRPAPAAAAVAFLADALERRAHPDEPDPAAIDALGWLELALDPAPRCVVVGMNESRVPGSITHDPLLPESLRRRVGLRTNDDRLARDAYLLAAIAQSRDASFIVPRRDERGDPVTPSRLLFRTRGPALAKRVRRFTDGPGDIATADLRLASRIAPGSTDRFAHRLLVDDHYQPPRQMSVTDFDRYLRSPMSWYLERHLRLAEAGPVPREMDMMVYGSFAHAVLEDFGADETTRELDEPDAIAEALADLVETRRRLAFGDQPPPAVVVQAELLRHRFANFAPHEAQRRREGWRIRFVEWSWREAPSQPRLELDTGEEPMLLRGKVDRIEVNDSSGEWALIDFKTGAVKDAAKSHFKERAGQWIGLQLPLYRTLTRELARVERFDPGKLQVGYGGLPTTDSENAWSFTEWTAADLDDAENAARSIVRDVRALTPGAELDPGEQPPDEGALGFITGERFRTGGFAGAGADGDAHAHAEEGAAV